VAAGSFLSYVTFINQSNTPCACHVIRDLRAVSGASLGHLKETLLQVSIDTGHTNFTTAASIAIVESDRLVMSVRLSDRMQKHDSYGVDF